MDDNLMKASDVAKFLGVHEKTVYVWSNAGFLPSIKMGNVLRFSREDVEKFLQENKK